MATAQKDSPAEQRKRTILGELGSLYRQLDGDWNEERDGGKLRSFVTAFQKQFTTLRAELKALMSAYEDAGNAGLLRKAGELYVDVENLLKDCEYVDHFHKTKADWSMFGLPYLVTPEGKANALAKLEEMEAELISLV
jgi:hypothetical protein